jgi:putative transposase
MRKETFAIEEYYHIYSRILLGIPEFSDVKNAKRLKQAFLLANSTNSGEAFRFLKNNKTSPEEAIKIAKSGKKLVNILCYVIMPNHYHLLLQEVRKNGIHDFIHKCNISIAKYINIKNERRGPLFESRFGAKHIDTNKYLLHLSLYIHLNPLDFLSNHGWRNHKIKNWHSEKKKLLAYPWSSIKAFLETDYKDPVISGVEIITQQFNNKKEYENFLREWSEESLENIIDFI